MIEADFVRLHRDAMSVLADWDHAEPQQRVLRDAYLEYLREHPDAMSRQSRIGHLTASALVMDENRTRVLLTLHPKVGRWLQLGGHVEIEDASLQQAARRETIEEGGIASITISAQPLRLDRHPVLCGGAQSEHLDVQYLALVAADAREVMSDESDDLRWFDVTALPEPVDPSVRALIDNALAQ